MMDTSIKFPVGRIEVTPAAQEKCSDILQTKCLHRHMRGDWGIVHADDLITNRLAIESGRRILSAYAIDESKPCAGYGDNTLWIITDGDRRVTTLLLPDEY